MATAFKQVVHQNLECPVCLSFFKDPKILTCSHTFCEGCLGTFLESQTDEQKLSCPVCREETSVPDGDVSRLQSNIALRSLVEDVGTQTQYIIKYRLARAALGLELLGCILEWEDFDAEADAVALQDAIRGIGTDEDAIIEILANRTNEQRQAIAFKYRACFGRDLKEELHDEVRGNLEKTVDALMDSPPMYDAKTLREAMKGLGTDEDTIIEIMCTRVNGEIEAIKMAYQIEFDRDLAEDLESETSGNFKYLMQCICAGGRDESGEEVDEEKAVEDAQELFDAGEDRWGTDENVFNRILATRSFPQLRATFLAYNGIAGCDIEDSIRDECMGDLQDGYLAIVSRAREVGQYFAERLYDSMKGAGTDEEKLIRIVISRSEIDLKRIKIAFFAKYGQTLHAFIEDDCSGDFKKMLLAILHGENDDE